MPVVKEENPITQFCFAMGIRGSVKLILGNKDEPQGVEENEHVLTSCDASSLVVDSLCDRVGGQDAAIACFYFDFAARKEQSPTRVLGALLRLLISGLDDIPEVVSLAYQSQKLAIGGREPRLSEIVKMLQTVTSRGPASICIDALDECVPEHRVKILDSLNQILQNSPGTRIFVTGRPHIRSEIGRRLAGRVTTLPISSKRDDIVRYFHSRLEEDTVPDAMDSSLEAEILRKILEDVSEMYV